MNKITHEENDTSEENSATEIELHTVNGEKAMAKRANSINFEVIVENRKVEWLITYSMDQQIFKFKVNSGNKEELWGVNIGFKSYHSKWTIDAILQHMGFYSQTENPNVMMRENHNTQSCEYILIYHDESYIASITPEEILHTLQDKYKINIYLQDKYPHDACGRDICQLKQCLEKLYVSVSMLFSDKLHPDLHNSFEIMKLLVKKGNLNLIHNKNTYVHFNYLSRKRKLDKLYNEV